MKKIGVVTSGGDASGMNAVIRAVVRSAVPRRCEVVGFERGYEGLVRNQARPLGLRSVSGIVQLGGTILRTVRSARFEQSEGLQEASRSLEANGVGGLIVIGGDGSIRGALELSKVSGVPVIGVPATIDNDVFGTDETVGFDTAVNTGLAAIDKIRDTAVSHERVFVVEVMGRRRGFLALAVGLTAGAEIILVPEAEVSISCVVEKLHEAGAKGKRSSIIVAAEGIGDCRALAAEVAEQTGSDVRLTTLGYVQRGGNPTARSRLLACLFGAKAVDLLLSGVEDVVVGLMDGKLATTDLGLSVSREKPLDLDLLRLAERLAA